MKDKLKRLFKKASRKNIIFDSTIMKHIVKIIYDYIEMSGEF